MTRALKLALAPLLVVQGLRTRKRTLRLPEPAGPREGQVGQGEPLSLLILGDSSAAGVGVPLQREALAGRLSFALAERTGRRVYWSLLARSGLNTLQLMAFWRRHGMPRAEFVVVVSGVNDVVDQVAPRRAVEAREVLAQALEQHAGARHVVFAALPPMQAFTALPQPLRWVAGRDAAAHDQALARWAQNQAQRSRVAVDLPHDPGLLAEDGFHPGPEVYQAWGEALAQHLAARVVTP